MCFEQNRKRNVIIVCAVSKQTNLIPLNSIDSFLLVVQYLRCSGCLQKKSSCVYVCDWKIRFVLRTIPTNSNRTWCCQPAWHAHIQSQILCWRHIAFICFISFSIHFKIWPRKVLYTFLNTWYDYCKLIWFLFGFPTVCSSKNVRNIVVTFEIIGNDSISLSLCSSSFFSFVRFRFDNFWAIFDQIDESNGKRKWEKK